MTDIRKLMEAVQQVDEYYSWDNDPISIEEFKGKVFTDVQVNDSKTEVAFHVSDRTASEADETYVMVHDQDCCESVWLEEVVGDLSDLIGSEILEAEEVVSRDQDSNAVPPPERYQPDPEDEWGYGPESYTWTFYKLGTMKGHVTLRWYGTSNGYYSESVSIYKKKDANDEIV